MSSRDEAVPMQADPTEWVGYVGLYLPVLIAWVLTPAPILSYAVAWLGSGWILWLSITGRVRPLPGDRAWDEQLFRPLFLSQGMFAGYLCLSSVFYVWDLVVLGGGGVYSNTVNIEYIAAAQRYSVLGHAAFVHGILAAMDYRRSGEWAIVSDLPRPRLFLTVGIGAFLLAIFVGQFPGLEQFAVKLRSLAVVGGILGFAYALRDGDVSMAMLGTGLYGWILIESFLSGWKEAAIVTVGLFLIALYPKYKRVTVIMGAGAIVLLVALLPAYNSTFRQLNWNQRMAEEEAAWEALESIQSGRFDPGETAWGFLTGRFTLIRNRAQYVAHTPEHHPYYGFTIVEQGLQSIIPRVFWPDKPITERVAMERVYENGVVARTSGASAKPSVIADGYLSGGSFGVLLVCLMLGWIAGTASQMAERWFGGYEVGGQVVFVGLFAGALLTASIEFLLNTLFWSFVLMGLLAGGLWLAGLLQWTGRSLEKRSTTAVRKSRA